MKVENQTQRRLDIEMAALAVLAERGYRRTSMLQIARRAKASNETLYAWYGSKEKLFADIIESNGRKVREYLEQALVKSADPLNSLEALGPILLNFTASDKAIIVNRAAVADAAETGLLAQAIDESARGALYPLVCSLMSAIEQSGHFKLDGGVEDAADCYLSLLFGETQFRQALGRVSPLSSSQINQRAKRAFELTQRLFSGHANP
ncbi:MAG: TetR/AcrR family transcriptional regulator [Burkholderiaceae bacterium]